MMRFHQIIPSLALLALCALPSCSKPSEPPADSIAPIEWQSPGVVPFLPPQAWHSASDGQGILEDALKFQLDIPEALETRLLKPDREIWKAALTHLEKARRARKDALLLIGFKLEPAQKCAPPSEAFSLLQRAQLQLAVQLQRNVLWRMGRLEMAARGVSNAVSVLLGQFQTGSIRGAQAAVIAPIMKIAHEIDALRETQPSPDGHWMPGEFRYRFARTAHGAPIFLQMGASLQAWQAEAEKSERYRYLAHVATPVVESVRTWQGELEAVIAAFSALTAQIQIVERAFAPPHAYVAYPCIEKNLKQLRLVSEFHAHVLDMQYSLTLAHENARAVHARLQGADYDRATADALSETVQNLMAAVRAQKARLSRSEDWLLEMWDGSNKVVWHDSLEVFIDPIHRHALPAVQDEQTWRMLYQDIRAQFSEIPKNWTAEPEQPPNRRGKPYPSYVHGIVEFLHSPARIDEVERSLLAISELEAHMLSIRDELLKLCKQGACRSFPEAEIANSPRTNAWVVSWRQSPSSERTLGHSLVVIKLCQLHISRLVQRLSEIYAWFSETSNADLSWKKLKSWQRIWTLYAEPNGTYASFLKSIAALDQTISQMPRVPQNRVASPQLVALLEIQDKLFDLTLDYARFLDARHRPPVTYEDLVDAWESLDEALTAIDQATDARDAERII